MQVIPEADVVCYGLWVDASLATRHGVFAARRETPGLLDRMWQKPSLETLESLSASHFVLMDIGLWLLSDRAVKLLRERDVQLKSISDGIDPSTTSGRLMLNMLATLAEYERELITERVNAGITAARNGGTKFGRPLSDPVVVADKLKLVTEARAKGRTAEDAAKLVGWSRATLYRHQQALAARAGCPGCPRRASQRGRRGAVRGRRNRARL